jgi:hypothetical protein
MNNQTIFSVLRWSEHPSYAEMHTALRSVGCLTVKDLPKGKGGADRAVRDRFHAEWTRLMYERTGIGASMPEVDRNAERRATAQARTERILALHAEGLNSVQIGIEVGLSAERVRRIWRDHGRKGDLQRAAANATRIRWARATAEDRARQGEMLRRTKGMRGVAA